MKTYVITLSFLEGDEPFVIDSELSVSEIKDKIVTAIKSSCSWESFDNFVDFGNDSSGERQLFPIYESIQHIEVETVSEWIETRRVTYLGEQE